jgi:actin-related protein
VREIVERTHIYNFFLYFILVDTTPVLVLDNGSAFLKVGFSDQALPKEVVSSVVGTPLRYSQDISGMEYNATSGLVFGSAAMNKAGVLHIGRFY